ncbi:isoamylase early set domain-containing protein [Anaerolineales bacterium HSG6]|nr:isoamylase early set domain-containing protein [Anaerolineales bacterium HSG6]MDM8529996.1 isoamylase early set domain-containing protein [Anaerolineales bacterium HSG25]
MIKKRFFKTKDNCKVSFELPEGQLPEGMEIEKISLVGDFNDWNQEATPLRRLKGGTWKEILDLQIDQEYNFRYVINGDVWYNDPEADGYASSGQDSENCIVNTTRE